MNRFILFIFILFFVSALVTAMTFDSKIVSLSAPRFFSQRGVPRPKKTPAHVSASKPSSEKSRKSDKKLFNFLKTMISGSKKASPPFQSAEPVTSASQQSLDKSSAGTVFSAKATAPPEVVFHPLPTRESRALFKEGV